MRHPGSFSIGLGGNHNCPQQKNPHNPPNNLCKRHDCQSHCIGNRAGHTKVGKTRPRLQHSMRLQSPSTVPPIMPSSLLAHAVMNKAIIRTKERPNSLYPTQAQYDEASFHEDRRGESPKRMLFIYLAKPKSYFSF